MNLDASDHIKDQATADATGAAGAREFMQWFVYTRNEVTGPFTHAEMADLVRDGQLSRQAQATRRAPPDWKDAEADEMLAPLFVGPEVNRLPPAPSSLRTEPGRLVVAPSLPNTESSHVSINKIPYMPAHSAPPTSPANTTTPHAAPAQKTTPSAGWALPPAGVASANTTSSPWDKRSRGRPAVEVDWRSIDGEDDPHPVSSGLVSLVLPGLGQLLNGEVLRNV